MPMVANLTVESLKNWEQIPQQVVLLPYVLALMVPMFNWIYQKWKNQKQRTLRSSRQPAQLVALYNGYAVQQPQCSEAKRRSVCNGWLDCDISEVQNFIIENESVLG